MTAPTVLVVQHQDDCPPAWFGTWIEGVGVGLDVRRPYAGDALPADLTAHAGLLVLGGSMGASAYERAPWLSEVKDLVRSAVAEQIPVLGICLGHQVVADALGGTVRTNDRGTQRDVLDVGWTDAAATDPVFASRPSRAAHWNNDVVTVPPAGSVVLAVAPGGEIQVLRFGDSAWGIQSHPEIDEQVLGEWIADERSGSPGTEDDGLDDLLAGMLAERDRLLASWRPAAEAFGRLCAQPGAPRQI